MPVGENSVRLTITLSKEDVEILDKFAEEFKTRRSTAASILLGQTLELTKNMSMNLIEMERNLNSQIANAAKK